MPRDLLISLHGIRTSVLKPGWQDELGRLIDRERKDYEKPPYGFLPAVFFLLPWVRERRVEWFAREYQEITNALGVIPSIVAHSFGTYIIAEAMRKYPHIKFDRMVFCGAIVETYFPWKEVFARRQFNQLLNQHGSVDFWAGMVAWAVKDAGPSGREGFYLQEGVEGLVLQEKYAGWSHGNYFHEANYKRWLSFTERESLEPVESVPRPRPNPRGMILLIFALLAFDLYLLTRKHVPWPPTLFPIPNPSPAFSPSAGTIPPQAESPKRMPTENPQDDAVPDGTKAERTAIELFSYASFGNSDESSAVNNLLYQKLENLKSEMQSAFPELKATLNKIRIVPNGAVLPPTDLETYWRSGHALQILSGAVSQNPPVLTSNVYLGDLGGSLRKNMVNIEIEISARTYRFCRDMHSALTLYTLAMEAKRNLKPNGVVSQLLAEARSHVASIVNPDGDAIELRTAINAELSLMASASHP